TPPDLLESLSEDEFFDSALGAMITSIASCPTQPDAEAWSDAIIALGMSRKKTTVDQLASIWSVQSVERSEAMRLLAARSTHADSYPSVWQILASDPRVWSPDFSKRAAGTLRGATPGKTDAWLLWSAIESASRLLHPSSAELFDELISALFPDGPTDSIRKSLDRIRLRADMHREFQS
ncbi:MAG: hypothetical protein K2X32_13270, partial [Phycisphaerales bacterium]|nr:hypothetical protein [Phycisphaerales bacterium]